MSSRDSELAQRRWRKELRRREIKEARKSFRHGRSLNSIKGYESPVLDLFLPDDARKQARKKNPAKTFLAPKIFSVSRNTAKCVEFFADIVRYVRTTRRPRVILDQRAIVYLGLGADSILGVILSEIKLELRHVYGAYIRGFKPKSKEIQRLMDEVGSVRVLFMDAEQDVRLSFKSKANVFRHRHRASDDALSTATHDPTADVISEFADHLDGSLSLIRKQLSVEGRDELCHYIAEVLDNVREHAGLREWAIAGYSDPDSKAPTYRCVIFCFGKTFADTFQELPPGSYPLTVIEPYLSIHRAGSLFGTEWREEDLITLIALQGDISSKNINDKSDRGQGTVELIQFFQKVWNESELRGLPAEMNIVSGSTRIKFDGKYRMHFRPDLNRHVIAFNEANDLGQKPDQRAVVSLGDVSFPGTLITVEIPLTSTFLEELEVEDEG